MRETEGRGLEDEFQGSPWEVVEGELFWSAERGDVRILSLAEALTSRWLKCTPFSLGWQPRKTAFDWLRALETTISISRIARNIKHFLAPFSRNITSSEFKFRKRY
jgi:hypothetical protein